MLASLENESATDVAVSEGTSDTTGDTAASDTETTETEAKENYYVVQWRKKNTDCLWRISGKVYNDASLWPIIYLANRDQIKNPDLIFPGQKFKIPPKPEKKPGKKELKEMLKKEKTEKPETDQPDK